MAVTQRHPNLLAPFETSLLIVDVQERFRAAIGDFESMLEGCIRLARTFQALDLPILVTEQYPKGLGHTVNELRQVLGSEPIAEKTTFSSLGCAGILEKLAAGETRSVLVCGIEAHVCVQQSVHDLLAAGYLVHVAVDAVASRHASNAQVARERMAASGAILTTTEMAAFELLVDAKHPKFKEVQALFR